MRDVAQGYRIDAESCRNPVLSGHSGSNLLPERLLPKTEAWCPIDRRPDRILLREPSGSQPCVSLRLALPVNRRSLCRHERGPGKATNLEQRINRADQLRTPEW